MNSQPSEDPIDPIAGWRLKGLHMADELPAMPISSQGMTLGRAASNDIVLDSEEFPGVSGTHARVVFRDGAVLLEDLESKNGTYVSGEPVTRVVMAHGDVFELGLGGARFVIISPAESDQTLLITDVAKPARSMGADTVEMVRQKLGIPAHTDVTAVVQRENRRNTYLLLVVLVFVVAAGIYLIVEQQARQTDIQLIHQRLDAQVKASKDMFDAHRASWEERVGKLDAVRKNWEAQRQALLAERGKLEKELRGRATAADLDKVRQQLARTDARIEKFNPVNLEQDRLATVSRVENAVVLIEVRQTFVEPKTKQILYVEDGPAGDRHPNLQQQGEVYAQESTGSGFCFHRDGWILTNAHVVLKKDSRDEIRFGKDVVLKSHVELRVVFSRSKTRYPARLVKWVSSGKKDLALIKIQPFPDMPSVPGIDTSPQSLPVAMDVFLLGFPLGKRALQQGETVIASTFRGIVSRTVDSYLQTDAAVHPGNSGGPVIDSTGRIIGVVVGMQRIDEHTSTHAIGYVIPIAHAKEVWPPKGLGGGK